MQQRQALHTLVDEIPEQELAVAQRFLEYLRLQTVDPLRVFLSSAPWEDEPVTEDDRLAIREGLREQAAGEVVGHDELERLLREAK